MGNQSATVPFGDILNTITYNANSGLANSLLPRNEIPIHSLLANCLFGALVSAFLRNIREERKGKKKKKTLEEESDSQTTIPYYLGVIDIHVSD